MWTVGRTLDFSLYLSFLDVDLGDTPWIFVYIYPSLMWIVGRTLAFPIYLSFFALDNGTDPVFPLYLSSLHMDGGADPGISSISYNMWTGGWNLEFHLYRSSLYF
jgi:hypothetical protein